MQEHIYVIVAQTGTNVAKLIKLFTRKPYNHVKCPPFVRQCGIIEIYRN